MSFHIDTGPKFLSDADSQISKEMSKYLDMALDEDRALDPRQPEPIPSINPA